MVAMYSQILPQEDPSTIIEHLFRIFDRDNDGTIDFKEFVLATEITTSGQPEEKLRWTFKVQLSITEKGASVSETLRTRGSWVIYYFILEVANKELRLWGQLCL